jgi:hypothetical protein
MTIPRNEQPRTQALTRREARPSLWRLFPANGCRGRFDAGYWTMASLSPEMPPDVQGFAELAQKLAVMMIYHPLM